MNTKIRVLDEHTINKIAAGEVIENPASVVKELVENAIDAGATEITVEIKGGGRQMIRITDNGCGMGQDDALLALERHATSKIREVEDILSVGTMGFRGEAIPSIASISKFMILTRTAENEDGTMVIVEGGKVLKHCPAARDTGTTIEVKSLFFNVPVRRKFQRSPTYDANEILKMLSMIALGNPDIRFELISNETTTLTTQRCDGETYLERLGQRIYDVLGSEYRYSTTPVEERSGDYAVTGYVGLPEYTRHNRTGQYLFINKRAIQSPLASFAVRDGYGTALQTNRHPIYVLHLEIPGDIVDVNVHPQKREVRLRQEQEIKTLIAKAVDSALNQMSFTPSANEEPEFAMPESPMPSFTEPVHTFAGFAPVHEEEFTPLPPLPRKEVRDDPPLFETPPTSRPIPKILGTIPRFVILDPTTLEGTELAQGKQGLCLVDQRAAHARIIYDKLLACAKKKIAPSVQTLLIPLTLELTPIEAATLRDKLDMLNDLGIQAKEFDNNTFVIDALPQEFGNVDVKALMVDLVKSMQEDHDDRTFEREKEKQLALSASRIALSSKQRISNSEAQVLVNQLMACETPFRCPNGKPTVIRIGSDELAKHFQ
ncbi:MAG: DNA mismatch repair endonuclease MutL [Chlamydiales bacterium]|nr:DNA mismatch repair endonuclease MutL [Chlamydiia bacterium]MCP5507997.1 DNA mismatch repair endonuclease MutL [Chlamydiales bacterium]